MAESRSSQIRSIQAEGAKRRDQARRERDQATKDITKIWNDGFKRLRQENDNYQKRRDDEYKTELKETDQWVAAQISQIGR